MKQWLEWLDSKRGFWISVLTLVGASALLRLIRITLPAKHLFDEVWYAGYGWKYLQGTSYYYDHPILSNISYLPGLLAFGNTPLGWRLTNWLVGSLLILGIAYLGYRLTKSRLVGVIAAFITSFDSLLFIYGRLAFADTILLALVVWGLVLFFISQQLAGKSRLLAAVGSAFLLGSAVAVKWTALGGVALVFVWWLIKYFEEKKKPATSLLIIFIIVPAVVYILWFIPLLGIGKWQPATAQEFEKWYCPLSSETWVERFAYWHCVTWSNHAYNIDRDHPYRSRWWKWPLVEEPILIYIDREAEKEIWAKGNHAIWWAGALAILAAAWSLRRRFRAVDAWLLLGFLGFWLPFAFVSRLTFLYSYLPPLIFLILILALAIKRILKDPEYYWSVIAYLLIVVLWFLIQYSSLVGI